MLDRCGRGRCNTADVLVDMSGEDVGAVVAMHLLAIPLIGGAPVELPPPPIRHEFGNAQG